MDSSASSEIVVRFRTTRAQRLWFSVARSHRPRAWPYLAFFFAVAFGPEVWRAIFSTQLSFDARLHVVLKSLGIYLFWWEVLSVLIVLVIDRAGDVELTVTLGESGIRCVGRGTEGLLRWDAVAALREAGGFLYLVPRRSSGLIAIPIAAFADAGDRARFEETIRARIAAV